MRPRTDRRERAVTQLDRAAATLAVVVLADSSMEHYRGGLYNRVMFAAPFLSAMMLGTTVGKRNSAPIAHLAAMTGGIIGTAFHLTNVVKREGGLSWLNLFYGAPIGAPLGLTFAGAFGLAADHVRANEPGKAMSKVLAACAAAGIAGTAAEAALLHFRGSFHNKLMYAPVLIPPAAALMIMRDVLSGRASGLTRRLLQATVALGFGGSILHTVAMERQMGGWKNWTQNLQTGPPIPAPPAFTAMALAALAALELMDARR